jgi:serine protease Do
MFRPVVSVFFAVVLFVPRASVALDTRDIFKSAEPSVVVVLASDAKGEKNSLGSGVLIAPLDIVTSCKVVEGLDDIVVTQGSTLRKGVLRYKDSERDLCQLHFEDPLPSGKPAVVTAASTVEIGQEVFVISSPRGMDRTLNRAMVSGLQEMSGTNVRLMSMDKPFATDSVGGGVFDQEARLVGVITPQFRRADSASHAIPAAWIADLAQRTPDRLLAAASHAAPVASAPAGNTAAAGDALPAGMPRTGDRWKYKLIDGKQTVGTMVVEITDVRGKMVTERITREGQKGFLAERSVSVAVEFNPLKFEDVVTLPGGYQLTEIAPYVPLGLEMKASQRWQGLPVTAMLPWYGKKKFLTDARVAGREKVRVPAGVFDTTRVQATGEENFGTSIVKINFNYWYSVDSMRTVKMSLEIKSSLSNQQSAETYELVAFEPAK